MKSRTTRGNSDTVNLFPFLAVLLCTMGALLVLLVVLAQKAKDQATDRASQQARTTRQDPRRADLAAEEKARTLERQLEQLHRYQQQLDALHAEAKSRQRDEQLRLSHLEEHTRRLEHELAKLYLASEQLKATKEKQIVDQEQAEHELARLADLVEESCQELETFREESRGKRSYAILPYRGPQGTVRRPIYVECGKEGVVIQPEGIRLTAKDFIAPFDSGNPLAKALRAARDLLNTRALKAGESEPPDPYPLFVVRPDGIQQYAVARTAIESWDADFGYEFINKEWSLAYPDTDPELAQAMRHAVLQGRERIAMLIQTAPRRYGRLGFTSFGNTGRTEAGNKQAHGVTDGALASTGPMGNFSGGQDIGLQWPYPADSPRGPTGNMGKGGESIESGVGDGSQPSGPQPSNLDSSVPFAANGASGGQAGPPGGSSATTGGSAFGSASTRGTMGSQGGTPSAQASGGLHASSGPPNSMASSRGTNWAIQNPRHGAVPIRRPIQVVIRQDQIAILRSRHATEDFSYEGAVISLAQPTERVMAEFATALREHMKEWGLAGNGLYWRPVLQLNIGPRGEQQAIRLTRLLEGSGVEISGPRTARKNKETPAHATK
jgi:biopolymer transport protein ExbD